MTPPELLKAREEAGTDYEALFALVGKPSRYIGGEWNSVTRPGSFREGAVGVCLCFPDLYETGFANTGIEILYRKLNARDDAYAERAYAADTDLAQALRSRGLPFFSLESRRPISAFDIVGFGLPYELCYTNILEMLDLSGIPLRSAGRDERHPLVIAGGPCAVNPEPLADFFDAVVIGDGEEVIGEIVERVREAKSAGGPWRQKLLGSLARVEGLYVPSLYRAEYHPDGRVASVRSQSPDVPARVAYRRWDISRAGEDGFSFPVRPVVPFVQTVHDRLNVEIQRGCPWRCRFCQAGFSYRPYRERSAKELLAIIDEGLRNTGYDAVTLAGLSAADHTEIVPLLQTLAEHVSSKRISIGLPSTRADRFTLALAGVLQAVRRQSLTFAPEGGTERLRRVIRKELTEFEIRETLKMAHANGWKNVKLYFMYGLPTETREDLEGIVKLVLDSRRENRGLSLALTLSPFVPKPHTPYQWAAQDRLDVLKEKLAFLRKNLPAKIRAHGLEQIVVEGVLSRGDRRCSELVEAAWKAGAVFDEWGERFRFEIWEKAMADTGLTPDFFCYRERGEDEVFPWDHLQGGPEKRALWNDYRTALRQAGEPLPAQPHLKERPEVIPPGKIHLPAASAVQRIRFRVGRKGSVRFLSHLEQIELVRRALRRAGFPVAFTSGFHPQMKAAFGPAISVGYESDCEYFDVELTRRMDAESAGEDLSRQLPQGFRLLKASRVPLFFPSLESLINRVDVSVAVPEGLAGGGRGERIDSLRRFLEQEDLALEKPKKDKSGQVRLVRIPLKPLILKAEWEGTGAPELLFSLRIAPGGNLKPERIAALYLGLGPEETQSLRVTRKAFYIEKKDGTVSEP
ncbi:MAG: hypothetical protein A2902_03240 [Elusimicrobia bacterium RIFCSPLOWO2_01_FULL_64_13]|nr:MAG: hypothetical protein A2902_03240 [Elusimicrobia bacterium RIFCSPLOWO2_01_FULL_64_13]